MKIIKKILGGVMYVINILFLTAFFIVTSPIWIGVILLGLIYLIMMWWFGSVLGFKDREEVNPSPWKERKTHDLNL